eukprot:g21715.t1
MTRWLWKVWYLVLCEAVVKKVDFQMSNRFIHFLERGRGMFASNPPQQEQGPLNSFLVGCWRGVLRDRLRGFFPIEESSGGRDRYTAAGQHGVTAVLFAWSLLRSSALHSLLFLVLSLRAVVLLLRWVDFSLVVLNGQESNVADISWALFGKVQNILELMMFLLISLGWKVLRATLDVSEIRFAVAISIISFYLGIFQVACTTPSQCSYLVIIVAMNFNLQKLASAIADAPATVESGKLYRKKVTIIPWDQQWLFVLLQELRTWVIYVLLIYAYRPDPTPLRVFQLTEREASDQDELGFRCWADYELRPLSEVAQDSHAASKLFEDCWRHLEPAVASAVQKMKGKAGVLQQPDEAYYWTLHGRAVEALKLAEYLPAEQALERLVDVLGRACNITFRALPARSWWQTGWHSGVRCFEVLDGPPLGIAAGGGRCLGYVYVELYGTWRGTRPLAPGALLLAPGHVYLGLHLQAPSMGMTKLLTPEDATMMAHELGHAVHMLCFSGSAQEFQDLPLDLLELPSTFAEVLATKPEVVGEYAQANPNFFAQKLQSWNVSLGLHSDFDAFAATPSELQDRAVSLWQRYSKVAASGSFSPLGEDAGGCLALGANQVAYLLCYLRTATLLRGKSAQGKSALKRWLSPDAAGKLRAQLLEQHSGFKWRKSRA